MRTALLFTAFVLASLANAQFSSGFESWNDTLPNDWIGAKTNLNYDSITQVNVNVHGGTYAVRLQNSTSNNKRLTTPPLAVDSGTVYDFDLWVRGHGDVHVAMFDERIAGSGYSPYSPYVTVEDDATWTHVTASVVCTHTSAVAEFIIGCRNTDGPEHLVVDDVNITTGAPPAPVSIYGIQYTTDVDGNSPEDGNLVLTGGIVTGVDTIGQNSYFIQAGTGPWSGIYVFDPNSAVAIGDSVALSAAVDEFNSLTELINVSGFTVIGQYPVPAPEQLSNNAASQEQWEGVLVHITNAICLTAPDGFNEWTVDDGSGVLSVDDQMYFYTPTVGTHYDITGIMTYSFGAWKLLPRMASDVSLWNGIEELDVIRAIYPNPANEVLTLTMMNAVQRNWIISDAIGREVLTGSVSSERSTIDVSGVVPGAYVLTLRDGAAVQSMPLQIVR